MWLRLLEIQKKIQPNDQDFFGVYMYSHYFPQERKYTKKIGSYAYFTNYFIAKKYN